MLKGMTYASSEWYFMGDGSCCITYIHVTEVIYVLRLILDGDSDSVVA